jgi:hypothetical protein
MNVIKLQGGLGNQFFQYAFGKAQQENGIDVRFDDFWFEHRKTKRHKDKWDLFPRENRLGMFNTTVNVHPLHQEVIQDTGVDLDLLKVDNRDFVGYWSDLRYSEHILPILRKEFCLKEEFYTNEFLQLKEQITKAPSVSVHIRRGDYIGRKGFNILPLSYYFKAIRETKGDLFIFSDDIAWCKQTFKKDYFSREVTFVELEDYLSFELMRLCSHNIIANSTFSWWAAYLNDNPDKIVITPLGWEIKRKKDVSIMIAYYDRPKQLMKTLDSLKQYDPNEFNVVIVDDASPNGFELPELPYEVKVVKLEKKLCLNPVVAFNIGFLEVLKNRPTYIIFQGVDCYHKGDLIKYVKEQMSASSYISFGCYSLSQDDDPDTPIILKNKAAMSNGKRGWYNHPIYKPMMYNFCSAISTDNLIKLNGFDERFKDGNAYEDNYFLHQVKTLGLEVSITDKPFVYHQYHPVLSKPKGATDKNRALYADLQREQTYRAVHILTEDLE